MSPVLLWFLIGILFFVIELVLPGFIIFFFGLGAWCTALGLFCFALSLTSQLAVFLVTSLMALLVLRTWLRSIFFGTATEEEDSINMSPVMTTGVITEDILPPARGRVQYGGSYWIAEAEEKISAGTVVKIVQQQDLLVTVKPLKTEGNS